MCRLYAFKANEPTRVECSLVRSQNSLMVQSAGDAIGLVHAHGWGVADYPEDVPMIERGNNFQPHRFHRSVYDTGGSIEALHFTSAPLLRARPSSKFQQRYFCLNRLITRGIGRTRSSTMLERARSFSIGNLIAKEPLS